MRRVYTFESRSGIYQIKHKETGKLYVGSAVCLRKRWNRHLFLLRKGEHDNIHLQRAWNLFGAEAFEFSVLEYVDEREALIDREKFWFIQLDVVNSGYNLSPVAGSRLGAKHSHETRRKISQGGRGLKRSEETRQRMSVAFTGRTHSMETRLKLSQIVKERNRSKAAFADSETPQLF